MPTTSAASPSDGQGASYSVTTANPPEYCIDSETRQGGVTGGGCGGHPRRGVILAFSWCCLSDRRSIYCSPADTTASRSPEGLSFILTVMGGLREKGGRSGQRKTGRKDSMASRLEGGPRGYVTVHVAKSALPCRPAGSITTWLSRAHGRPKDAPNRPWSDFCRQGSRA